MQLYDDATTVSAPPAPPAAGTPGYFTDGTIGSVARTIIRAWWLNLMQSELVAIVVAGGITPSRTVANQVLTAIQTLISNAVSAAIGTEVNNRNTAITNSGFTLPATRTQAVAGSSTTLAVTPDDLIYVLSTLGLGAVSGEVKWMAASVVPAGWLECNGSLVSRTTYAALYAVVGTVYGAGDGSTTFALPDLRGQFVRGFDHGRGVDTGRTIGTTQTDAMQGHVHQLPSVPEQGTGFGYTGTAGVNNVPITQTGGPVTDGTNGTPRTAAETRPTNVAMLPIIKT